MSILDDDSDTATEGEEEIRQRELRKQEVRLEVPDCLPGRNDTDTGSDTEVKTIHTSPSATHCSSSDNLFCSLSDLTTLDSDVPMSATAAIKINNESRAQTPHIGTNLEADITQGSLSTIPLPSPSTPTPTPQCDVALSQSNSFFSSFGECKLPKEVGNMKGSLPVSAVSPQCDLVPVAFDALFNELCGDFDSDQMSIANYSVDSDSLHGHGWSDTESVINMNCTAVLKPVVKSAESLSNLAAATPVNVSSSPKMSTFNESTKKINEGLVKVAAKIVDAESFMPSKSKPILVNRINCKESESKYRTESLLNRSDPCEVGNSSATMREVNSKSKSLLESLINPSSEFVSPKSPSKSAPPSPKWKESTSNSLSIPPSPKPIRQKRNKAKDISTENLNGNSVLKAPRTPTRRRKHKVESKSNSDSTDTLLLSRESRKLVSNKKGSMQETDATKSSNGHDSGHSTASVTPSSPPATPSSLPTTPILLSRPSSPAVPVSAATTPPCSPPPSPLVCRIIASPTPDQPQSASLDGEAAITTPLSDADHLSELEAESSVDDKNLQLEATVANSRVESPKPSSRPLSPPVSRPMSPVLIRRRSSGALSSLSSRRSSLTASRYNMPITSSYSTTRYSTPSTSYNYPSRYSSSTAYSSTPSAKPSYISSSYSSPSYSSTSYASPSYSSPSHSLIGSLGTGYTSKYAASPNSSYYASPSSRTSSATRSSKSRDGCIVS